MNKQEMPKAFFNLSEEDKEKVHLFEMDVLGLDYRYRLKPNTKPLKQEAKVDNQNKN